MKKKIVEGLGLCRSILYTVAAYALTATIVKDYTKKHGSLIPFKISIIKTKKQ